MSGDLSGDSYELELEELDRVLDELALLLGELTEVPPPEDWAPTPRGRRNAMLDTTRSPATQKKVFERRSGQLDGRLRSLDKLLEDKKFGDPLPDPLTATVEQYETGKSDATQAASGEDYLTGNKALSSLEEAASVLESYLPAIQAFDDVRELIRVIDAELVTEGYTTHPAQVMLKPRFDNYTKVKSEAATTLSGLPDLGAASTMTSTLEEARQRFPKAMKAIKVLALKVETAHRGVQETVRKTESQQELYEELDEWQTYLDAKEDVEQKVNAFKLDFGPVAQSAALKACETDFPAARATLDGPAGEALAARFAKLKPAALRTELSSLCQAGIPDTVAAIGKAPGGRKMLDDVMKNMGSKVTTPEDKKLAAVIIQGVYGPKIEGKFGDKNLPLLYKTLGMVPPVHLKKSLNEITSHKFDDDYVAGDYSASNKTIRLGSTQEGDNFKSTTLHEVGHAVDDANSIMKNGGPAEYGGWRKETKESVVEAIYAAFHEELGGTQMWTPANAEAVMPPAAQDVKDYLVAVLGNNDAPTLANDDGARQSILAGHQAVELCKQIRLKNKFWDHGDSAASTYKLGKRVYQEAGSNDWWSYEFAQRKTSFVRNYGFRSPAEWFAEAYDSYYRGKLKKTHPAYKWLDENKKSGGVKV